MKCLLSEMLGPGSCFQETTIMRRPQSALN